MRIERSPHVRDQLRLLESHVVSTKKKFNFLRSERRSKSRALQFSLAALQSVDAQQEATTYLQSQVKNIERTIEETLEKLEKEEAEAKMLLHMKACRRDWLVEYLEPMEKKKAEVARINEIVRENTEELYHSESETKSVQFTLGELQQSLNTQRQSHAQMLAHKASEYRDRREFVELYMRQEEQKDLARKIRKNENDLKAIQSHCDESASAEAELQAFRTSESQAKSQEYLFEKLGHAASAYQITDIVEYWVYLQNTKSQLETGIEMQTAKLAAMRKELESAKNEFAEARWAPQWKEKLSQNVVEKFLARIAASNENLDQKLAQLATWEMYVSQVSEALNHILQTLNPEAGVLSLEEICYRIADSAELLMDKQSK